MIRSLRQEDQKLKASMSYIFLKCKEKWRCGSEHRVCLVGGSVSTDNLMKSRITWAMGPLSMPVRNYVD